VKNWQEQRIDRLEQLQQINYPAELPISEKIAEIKDALQKHQVIIVAGDTGSGKTTQLPKICLALGRGRIGRIGHTQPRRIAARSVAQRIAEELQTALGDVVGYKTRFREQLSPQCAIKLMTDGILLAEMQQDRALRQYDTLIIDEAHERSVNIDFILGYIKQLLPRRPDLKVIVTSATLDVKRFSTYFNAPIIEVEGRSYPIEIQYKSNNEHDLDDNSLIVSTIRDLLDERKGDILVFLPTERVIHEVEKSLREIANTVEVLPLFSRLAIQDQNKIFSSSNKLRVILSTNVAETSLTVPGIRYVVDEGSARISRYSQRMKVQRLPIERISQASARQRAGRCGRVGPGKCIRLYAHEDFETRDEFTLPEILRTNLAQIILRMTSLRLGKIEEFPFIQPPNPRYINDGYQLLLELGAIDAQKNLTSLGEKMSKLTVDPRLSRLLIAGSEKGCLAEITIIASFLEAQDPRIRPKEKLAQADQLHAQYNDKKSDFLGILNLWNAVNEQKSTLSKNQFRQFCEKNYLSMIRFNEWHEMHAQLNEEASHLQLRLNQQPAGYEVLHKALLQAFFTQIACKQEKNDYLSTRGNRIKLFPGSAAFKTKPQWIMAGLLLETEQLYAHLVAAIEPDWVIEVAPQWVKRHYGEPVWEKSTQRVSANCRTTLLGLTLNDKQRASYENIDPLVSREIFIRGALVQGEWLQPLDFFIKNQQALEQAKQLEEQSRRRDIVIDEELLHAFYADNLPLEITGVKKLEKWYRDASNEEKQKLVLTQEYIIRGLTEGITSEKFPGQILYEGKSWPLSYHFAPGTTEDGITVTVPLENLTQAPQYLFEWLVPGFLPEKVEALLRLLPKMLRKKIMPLQNVGQEFVKTVRPTNQPIEKMLMHFVEEKYNCKINKEEWLINDLAPHFFMYYKIIDKKSVVCAAGRDYDKLVEQFSDQAKQSQEKTVKESLPQFAKITQWTCSDLPTKLKLENSPYFYPALKDEGESVSVIYSENENEAMLVHRRGISRLMYLNLRQELNYLKKQMLYLKTTQNYFCSFDQLIDDLFLASIERCFLIDDNGMPRKLPRTAKEFEALFVYKKNLVSVTQKMAEQVKEILALANQINGKLAVKSVKEKTKPIKNLSLNDLKSMKSLMAREVPKPAQDDFLAKSKQDIAQQLENLIYPGFITATPLRYWNRITVYLQGIILRLEKLSNNPAIEKTVLAQFEPALAKYLQLINNDTTLRKLTPPQRDALENYRWMLEEYRLSLFSQPMKTLFKVSDKRLEEEWDRIFVI
jgi:ATP-dependent helicase HrpA